VIEVVLVGLAAGFVAGMLGVGGGVLIVPGLALFAGLSQLDAEATSLVAIVPTALIGAWRQDRYGNVRWREAILVGVLSAGGGLGGVALANVLPQRALELAFAGLIVFAAFQLARRALKS
jgi:uncharacterized membrane protein YfcA